VQKIPDIGGGAPVVDPTFIIGLDGASNFTIVPLDANETEEFKDFIYVAIEEGTNNLLEIANFNKVLQIDDDEEMKSKLQEKYPEVSFEIIPGCFWKPCFELRSHLSIARRFRHWYRLARSYKRCNTRGSTNQAGRTHLIFER